MPVLLTKYGELVFLQGSTVDNTECDPVGTRSAASHNGPRGARPRPSDHTGTIQRHLNTLFFLHHLQHDTRFSCMSQVVALYNKAMRKFSARLLEIQQQEIESESAAADAAVLRKAAKAQEKAELGGQVKSLEQAQAEAAANANSSMRAKQRALLQSLDLSEYNISAPEEEWNEALSQVDNSTLGAGQIALPKKPLSHGSDDVETEKDIDLESSARKKSKRKKRSGGAKRKKNRKSK